MTKDNFFALQGTKCPLCKFGKFEIESDDAIVCDNCYYRLRYDDKGTKTMAPDKHCPFCGSGEVHSRTKYKRDNVLNEVFEIHYAECGWCRAQGPSIIVAKTKNSEERNVADTQALAAWNKRVKR